MRGEETLTDRIKSLPLLHVDLTLRSEKKRNQAKPIRAYYEAMAAEQKGGDVVVDDKKNTPVPETATEQQAPKAEEVKVEEVEDFPDPDEDDLDDLDGMASSYRNGEENF